MEPFDHYPRGGYELLGVPPRRDNTVRHGYGPPVFECCGMECAYCGRNLCDQYESWLDIQRDHVVPVSAKKLGISPNWIEDKANQVTCCAACNSFLCRFTIAESPPASLEKFFRLRDRVFVMKRERALRRHAQEREYWAKEICP